MPSFAEFALAHMPRLARRLEHKDVNQWLALQPSLDVDGAKRWLVWGDRLADEAEMRLDWARVRGLVDPATLARLEQEYGTQDPDVEAVEIVPSLKKLQEKDDG